MHRFRPIFYACFTVTSLAGCMALPFASSQLREYEGELAPDPIVAVEDGRRVEFAMVTVMQRQNSPYNVHPEVLLVGKANAAPTTLPVWTANAQVNDHAFLERIYRESPLYRRPDAVGQTLGYEPTLIPWNDGYVVSTRPFAVAFPVGLNAFASAQRELADGALPTRKTAAGFMGYQSVERQPGVTLQQYKFQVPWVETGALSIRVDVVEVLVDADTLRVIRLDTPLTIDALLDLIATPRGLEGHIAEEIRQPRTLPTNIRDAAIQYPHEFPRL